MKPRSERSLIFFAFVSVGVLIVGLVSYRAATTPAISVVSVAMLPANYRPAPTSAEPATARDEATRVVGEPALIFVETSNTASTASKSTPVSPATVAKSPERETVAMLTPVVPRRERLHASSTQAGVKTSELDICAKVGKKRVYYMKGNGKYWRCR